MDFKDELLILAERVGKLKDNVKTEEATKTSFVLPFLQALGYDIFNPEEVTPECICDYGTKKGEKIDYTVCMDGEPIMLIECKHWSADLSKYKAQLFRYYHVSQAKFGVLTNGINYQFYTDLDTPNKMDDKPFFEIDMLNLKDSHIEKLKQFRHDQYNTYMILNSATEMKYINALRSLIVKESSNPSDLFVKFMTKQVYDGVVTKNIIDEFRPMIQRAFQQYTNDYINERLKSAITPDVPSVEVSSNVSTEKSVANEEDMQDGNKIVTTDEEQRMRILRVLEDHMVIEIKGGGIWLKAAANLSVCKDQGGCAVIYNEQRKQEERDNLELRNLKISRREAHWAIALAIISICASQFWGHTIFEWTWIAMQKISKLLF